MSALVNQLVAQVIGLEVGLLSCQARLAALTDGEALHDLRTTVRRLRSLLRPLRGLPGVEQLESAARTVGQLTTPLRDREVLAAYLHSTGIMKRLSVVCACNLKPIARSRKARNWPTCCKSSMRFHGLSVPPNTRNCSGACARASRSAWPSNGKHSITRSKIQSMIATVCAC